MPHWPSALFQITQTQFTQSWLTIVVLQVHRHVTQQMESRDIRTDQSGGSIFARDRVIVGVYRVDVTVQLQLTVFL